MAKPILPSLVLALALAGHAFGQAATTVQLPTFNFTTVNTTVTVPDGGSAYLGGIDRARSGSVTRGVPVLGKVPGLNRLFKNRGIGREIGSSSFSVTARIINLEEEEEKQVGRVLAGRRAAGGSYLAGDPVTDRRAAFITSNVARPAEELLAVEEPVKPVLPSAEEIRRQNELAEQQQLFEAVAFLEKGKAAAQAGKLGAARVYYNMAVRRASGDLKTEVLAHLDALNGESDVARVAARKR